MGANFVWPSHPRAVELEIRPGTLPIFIAGMRWGRSSAFVPAPFFANSGTGKKLFNSTSNGRAKRSLRRRQEGAAIRLAITVKAIAPSGLTTNELNSHE